MELITGNELVKYLKEHNDKVCVMFYKENTAPCETMQKILIQYEKIDRHQKIFLVKNEKDISDKYGVDSVPMCIVFENGEPMEKRFGTLSVKDLCQLLSAKK